MSLNLRINENCVWAIKRGFSLPRKYLLLANGCKKIITDEISGSVADRPGLTRFKEDLREGDTVVVWQLDRLGRSLKHLIALINEFEQLKVGFESLQESINTFMRCLID